MDYFARTDWGMTLSTTRDAYILMVLARIEMLITDEKVLKLLGCIRNAIEDYPTCHECEGTPKEPT